ncbi:hypothetical protein ACFFVB_15235 [Formosa undariae]|uniref:DUF4468 domain-containing protein n=1 Tax=Formosa undariae TaxID=1325436 RepID=A0ABV5F4S1_9FLAO
MKKIILLLVVSVCFSSFAQSNLNDYKYVVVPNKYDFLKESNQYQLNELTKFLFEKKGFSAMMEGDEMSVEQEFNRCLILRSDVKNESNMFTTKLVVVLKDCKNKVVFETAIGVSKIKEFKKAYHAALRDAFNSFDAVNYKYTESSANLGVAIPAAEAAVTTAAVPSNAVSKAVVPTSNVLYAQPTANGYQLVDSTPKVVYKLKKSSVEDMYFVEGKQATVRKKGDQWVIEYYEGDTLKEEVLNVKF